MKEIDFLPDWYKQSRRRRISVRRQVIALGGVFLVLMTWNLISTNSISKATAELIRGQAQEANARTTSTKFAELRGEISLLQKKARFLEKIDSRIDVAETLAEMSALVDNKVVLSKVQFVAERFPDKQGEKPRSGSAVRAARSGRGQGPEAPLGNVRFKVLMEGVAADASDVAALVQSLERSPYFRQVYPSFSKNTELAAAKASGRRVRDVGRPAEESSQGTGGHDTTMLRVTEFQITCLLANYNELTKR
jgi:hypothetical protein